MQGALLWRLHRGGACGNQRPRPFRSYASLSRQALTDRRRIGDSPQTVALNATGSRPYVTNSLSNSVSVIDTATAAVIDIIPVADGPFGIAVGPDGTRAYLANFVADTVSVIDTSESPTRSRDLVAQR